ncbi:MAG: sigma-70 family RNA polymerase sigma factor [Candidatus Omnitrophica bacterium]|nr:sigma-70 family RNA polymerase sigma factor [Candidatus Omnitrophota bacterium]
MGFEELVKKISPKLKGIIYRLGGRFSGFGDDDLYQDAMIHLWEEFNHGTLQDKTDSYILQGCYFHLKNHMRKFAPKLHISSPEYLEDCEDDNFLDPMLNIACPGSLHDTVHCEMLIEQIRNNGLTKQEKRIFNFALEGLTVREIGTRIGVSHVRVVKLRKSIALKCLKHMDVI